MAKALVELLKKQFGDSVHDTHSHRGDETVVVDARIWKDAARFLRDTPSADMKMLIDLTCVDFPERDPRFEVVLHLYSLNRGHRLRLKARVGDPEGETAEIDSLTELWGAANWLEREAYDMFGVKFIGHPDLRRILMYPEFEGHALRKDYPANRIQPLVPYRDVPNTDKLAPFGDDEGMPFARQHHAPVIDGEEDVAWATDDRRID